MTPNSVALPMYDWPEIRTETDQFYALLRESLADRGFAPPHDLNRELDPMTVWQSPNLLLAQTCGLPLVTRLRDRVSVVGTPAYDIDCSSGRYFSVLVAHRDSPFERLADLAGTRFALNEFGSQSGYAAPLFHLGREAPEVPKSLTYQPVGSHRAALRAVSEGVADFAAIDAVSWAHARRHEPSSERLRVLSRTPPTPGLPFITTRRPAREVHRLHLAVVDAMAALNEPVRDALLLLGFAQTHQRHYRVIERRHAEVIDRFGRHNSNDKVIL